MTDAPTHQHDLEARTSRLEAVTAEIAATLENLSVATDRVAKGLDRLREQRTVDARPQYGLLVTLIGVASVVVLGIVGIAGNGYVRDQTRIEHSLTDLTAICALRHESSMSWEREHEWEVRDTNARQFEQIDRIGELDALRDQHVREMSAIRHAKELP